VRLGIFSSGAVLAQRWLFRCSSAGDLSSFLHWYFDTHTGAKQDPESYRRIAAEVGEAPTQVLFVSDVAAELNAARTAGMATIMTLRPGNAPQPPHDHRVVRSFDEITASSA
jgi:enolase-phosphatase E1